MIAVDTNVIVRLLVADDRRQANRARRLFEAHAVLIPTTVLLEAESVLRSAYDFKPTAISEAFHKLLGLPQVSLANPDVVHVALTAYSDGLDFADALHLAGSADALRFATFDQNPAAHAPSNRLRLGGDSGALHKGRSCCSTYCFRIDNGAPPAEITQ